MLPHANEGNASAPAVERKPMQRVEKASILVRLNPAAQERVAELFHKFLPMLPCPAAQATSDSFRVHHVAKIEPAEVVDIVLAKRREAKQQLGTALLGIEHLLRELRRIPAENREQERLFA